MTALVGAGGEEAVVVAVVEAAVVVTEIVVVGAAALLEGLARERTFPPITFLLGIKLVSIPVAILAQGTYSERPASRVLFV